MHTQLVLKYKYVVIANVIKEIAAETVKIAEIKEIHFVKQISIITGEK